MPKNYLQSLENYLESPKMPRKFSKKPYLDVVWVRPSTKLRMWSQLAKQLRGGGGTTIDSWCLRLKKTFIEEINENANYKISTLI